jgi:hypothetical protein
MSRRRRSRCHTYPASSFVYREEDRTFFASVEGLGIVHTGEVLHRRTDDGLMVPARFPDAMPWRFTIFEGRARRHLEFAYCGAEVRTAKDRDYYEWGLHQWADGQFQGWMEAWWSDGEAPRQYPEACCDSCEGWALRVYSTRELLVVALLKCVFAAGLRELEEERARRAQALSHHVCAPSGITAAPVTAAPAGAPDDAVAETRRAVARLRALYRRFPGAVLGA